MKKATPVTYFASLIITCLVFGIIFFSINGIDATITSTDLEINGIYGTRIKFDSISSIEKIEALPSSGLKLNGVNLGFIKVGFFSFQKLGKVRLFALKQENHYLLIETTTEKLVLGFGKAKNEIIYDALAGKIKLK
jgi:hypothetical protein